MSHLLRKAPKFMPIQTGFNMKIESFMYQRRFLFQTNASSAISHCLLRRVVGHSRFGDEHRTQKSIFQHRNGHEVVNSTSKRWLTSTHDHAKNFNFIADAVEVASPAVVYVDVRIQQQGGLFGSGGVAQGAGSGFIVTDYGVILTNAHVVNNATSVAVKLASSDVRINSLK